MVLYPSDFIDQLDSIHQIFLSCIIQENFITTMDLVNSAAFYSKNVCNVLCSTTSLIFLHMPCVINHLHRLITKSSE